ncbi:immunoglobulin-like domain-containing protein [Romboutsia sp.]|uniref:immunoglobulin-like domain-containing protein n=1 Tax=Romboutsia sp. TaxID=1965302 RepID=UPI003F3AAE99
MKNYKKNIAILLASVVVFGNSETKVISALGTNNSKEKIIINADSKEQTIKPMDTEQLSNYKQRLIYENRIAPEKPYVTSIKKSEVTTGTQYYAEVSIVGQARAGSTVYAKLGTAEASYTVGDTERFGFNIKTYNKDITVELYTVDSKGQKSENTFVRVTSGGDYIINNGTTTNTVPTIIAKDIIVKPGTIFNPLDYVKVEDKEDGDISKDIVVVENTVDASAEGVYKVIYTVKDSDDNIAIKEIKVTVGYELVIMNRVPEITATDVVLRIGDLFNPLSIVSAKDYEDGDISNSIEILENTVDTTKVGTYKVVYKVTDSEGASSKKEINVVINNLFTTFAVNSINNKSITLIGNGISGATVTAYVNNKQIGNVTTVDVLGRYKIDIPQQLANTIIVVKMRRSGYETEQTNLKVNEVASKYNKLLTKDIYKYDVGKDNHLTYINGKGYSQYSYLNTSGKYAFTPSSWMKAAGLEVSMPTSSNGYMMKIDNPYIKKYEDTIKQINEYL